MSILEERLHYKCTTETTRKGWEMFGRGRNYQRFEDDNVGNQRTTQTEKENGHDEEQGSRPSEANATESKPDGTAAKTTNVNSIKVKVLDTQGRTYTVPVPAGGATTVADLKSALAAEGGAGVATELQRLIYAGRILEDSQTLQSCGITGEQTVVHLFARPWGRWISTFFNQAGGFDFFLHSCF